MFDRRNQILTIILVVQIAVAAFLFWPQPVATSGGTPLLPDLQPADVSALTVKAGDAEGGQVDLTRAADGWVLAAADGYPADSVKVEEILGKLQKVDTSRLVTQTDASHARLQVADDTFNRLIQLQTKDGQDYDLYIGASAGGSSTHVRAGGQSQVYLTSEIVSWDLNAQPSGWLNAQYFTAPATGTLKMTLTNANGNFEFLKDETGWQMTGLAAGEQLNPGSVLAFYNQARAVSLLEPIGKTDNPEFGLADPAAVLTITNSDAGVEKTHTLTIGPAQTTQDAAQPGAVTYVAKSSESPYYVRLAGFTGSTFVDKQRADFLQAEAQATQ